MNLQYKKTPIIKDESLQKKYFADGDCFIIALSHAMDISYKDCVKIWKYTTKIRKFFRIKTNKDDEFFQYHVQRSVYKIFGGIEFKIWKTHGKLYLLNLINNNPNGRYILCTENDDERLGGHCVFMHNGFIYDQIEENDIQDFYGGEYIVSAWRFPEFKAFIRQ